MFHQITKERTKYECELLFNDTRFSSPIFQLQMIALSQSVSTSFGCISEKFFSLKKHIAVKVIPALGTSISYIRCALATFSALTRFLIAHLPLSTNIACSVSCVVQRLYHVNITVMYFWLSNKLT